ncbi:glutamate receptor ionotropic, kainate 2-like [Harmonia axyridis]|uniref:glutamate receptor ionotropic, kainate 2-like n=1 Tax=Harmonia axyridis TaxID=115357 RepID=UPI001E2756EC|nr:glutamate receptor ionotropic, kainate 2-like [Harmonia axyridis]
MKFHFCSLFFLSYVACVYFPPRDRIPLGVLMEEPGSQTLIPVLTSLYANHLINQNVDYHMKFQKVADDSYEASKIICNLTSSGNGVTAFISSLPSKKTHMLDSICAEMEIPHIQLLWDSEPTISKLTSLNFYPGVDLFAEGLATIVQSLQWKSFVVLYEDESSLLRLKYILKLEPYNPEKKWNSIRLKKLGPGPDYRGVFKDIKHIPETNIILDCKTEKILDVLQQAQSVRMLEIFHSYFLTPLDAHTIDLESLNYKANITTIRIFQPEHKLIEQAIRNWELAERNFFNNTVKYDRYTIKTSTVLMHDAVEHLIGAINDFYKTERVRPIALMCNDTTKFESGFRLISYMKIKPADRALTGPIQFNKNGTRIDFTIYLIKGTRNHTLNSWRAQDQNLLSNRTQKEYEKDVEEMLKGEDLVIASRIMLPYLSYVEGHQSKIGNDKYEGYAKDLMDLIAKIAGFQYTFELVNDNQAGTYDKTLGRWNGLIGEITEHRAQMAISDLAMTAQRQQVVDFSSPFMNLGIGLMVKKATIKEIPLFSFLDPFTQDVWAYTATLLLGLSLLFFLAYRLAPNEWVNPHPCEQNPDELEIEWNFKNCVWLVLGSLLQQGCDILPRSLSTRVSLSLWWFFSLIMYNSYTANLAAFLTTEKAGITVKNVEELAKQTTIKYGCMEYSATYEFFKNSDYTTYRKMWNNMKASNNPSVFVKNDDEGVKRVLSTKDSLYAYLTESTIIDYNVKIKCDLKSVGNWLNSISYAIAMPMNAGYLGIINSAILNLSESGELDKLKEKWWKQKRNETICQEERKTGENKSLKLNRVAGVFLVTGIGIATGYIVAMLEFLWNVKSVAIDEKMSYLEALKHEFMFAINLRLQKKRTKHKITPGISSERLNSNTMNNRSRSFSKISNIFVNNESNTSNIDKKD